MCTGVQFSPSPLVKTEHPKGCFCFLSGEGAECLRTLRGELKGGVMFCEYAKQTSRGRENAVATATELFVTKSVLAVLPFSDRVSLKIEK